ncbi:MAG TPA: methyltransferase domain-containing protein [Candidatus Sulfotelmatobacter sp.]|nr:methyltransferase domain-containing protein [Candidatus Sulfotelmatobacter sp.]
MDTIPHSLFSLAYLFLIAIPATLVARRTFGRHGGAPIPSRLEIRVEELGGFGYPQLVLISFLSLFLEMLMIRWVSSEIRIFAYFKNFVLVACFLGFGVGCYLCRRRVQLIAVIAPLLLVTLILKAPIPLLRRTMDNLPQMLGAGVEVHVWGVPALPASWSEMLLAIAVVVPLFALVATTFIPLGQLVGWYLENAPRGVFAYSVNVLASLAGIGAYTLLCFRSQPPSVWFFVAGAVCVLVFWRNPWARALIGATFLACVIVLAIPDQPNAKTYWSPYQKLVVEPLIDKGQTEGYVLKTNGTWYQKILDLSPAFVRSHPTEFLDHPVEWNSYNLPYRFYPSPPSVLVLGSGMGNDVAAALRNGAGRVVAVEIDPLILQLGRELHSEHPYESPRTQVIVNDARSYVENSRDQFDLIVFSLLDSHTTTSHFTNIRIDNYVYTREALRRTRQLLRPDGLFIVKFQVDTPWIASRLFNLMQDAFGQTPVQFQTDLGRYESSGRFFVAGSRERLMRATSEPALAAYLASHSNIPMRAARLTTDDWPYFYQHAPGLPISVILVSIAVLIMFGWFLRQTKEEGGRVSPHFMLLGAGFMLLEAQIVSKMALLFGTTWVVNSIVVSGLLCLIVAANIVYASFRRAPVVAAYTGLFVSLALMFAVPTHKLFFEPWLARAVAATVVLCLPVFFAGIVFISSFARANFRASALGSNLFGSLVGGLLESFSLWFGLRSLTIFAAILYLGSAIFLQRRGDLETDVSASGLEGTGPRLAAQTAGAATPRR